MNRDSFVAPSLQGVMNKQLHKTSKTKRKVDELHPAEKLIIYYIMNLFLLRELDMALHMITNYALKAHGSELFEANIHRILGLIQHSKVDIEASIQSFKKAKQLYSQVGSIYGVALCKFSHGFIYRSKVTEFTSNQSESIYKRSKQCFETALMTFEELNHIVG